MEAGAGLETGDPPGGLAVLVYEPLARAGPGAGQHHVAQPDVSGVVGVVRHPAPHPHDQHELDCLEGAEEPGGGAAAGDAGLPAVARHGQLGHHAPVAADIAQRVGLGLACTQRGQSGVRHYLQIRVHACKIIKNENKTYHSKQNRSECERHLTIIEIK